MSIVTSADAHNEKRSAMKDSMILAVAFSMLLGGSEARAQAPVRLTLDDALVRAVETSHRLAEMDARRASLDAAAQGQDATDRPVVSLQAGYTRTNHVPRFFVQDPLGRLTLLYPDLPNNYRTRIDLQWPIYTGGRADALTRAARADADALGQDRAAAQADLRLEVTRAYWSLVTARASVGVVEQALARMDAHLGDARSRLQNGLVPPSDVLSSEALRSRQQMLLIEARNLQESAATDLRRLVGLQPDAPVEIDAALIPPPAPAAIAAALVDQARLGRPERRAFEIRMQGADERQAAAKAGRRPTITVGAGDDFSKPNPAIFPRTDEWQNTWDVGVDLNWSLWDGGRVGSEVAVAVANRRAVEAGLREFDAMLDSDVRQRRLDLESALAGIASAEDGVRSATEARRVLAERYSAGISTNTDALDAQSALMQAELDRTRAIADARLAAARLDRALGR